MNFDPFLPRAAQCLKLLAFPLAFERGEASFALLLVKGVGKCQPLTAEALISSRFLDRRSPLGHLARHATGTALDAAVFLVRIGAGAKSDISVRSLGAAGDLQNGRSRRPWAPSGCRPRAETGTASSRRASA